jgi:hypothetical protein
MKIDFDDCISYTLSILTGGNGNLSATHRYIGYCSYEKRSSENRIVIIPCGLFGETYGKHCSLPTFPISFIEGTPLLYGTPDVEWRNNVLVIHADIVASSYFLLTRYEEVVRRNTRDQHGRFPGEKSLPFRAGFIQRPIVDEYAELLRKWLMEVGVSFPENRNRGFKVYLTHDVDVPWAWHRFRAVAKSTLKLIHRPRQLLNPVLSFLDIRQGLDPFDCFEWILAQDGKVRDSYGVDRVASVYFFLAGGNDTRDGKNYIHDRRFGRLVKMLKHHNAVIGLHSSYSSGRQPALIEKERRQLQAATDTDIRWNRHHFLASREPEDMAFLESAGITDDFTMAYPDVAGFRLGTCRPIRWFDPVVGKASKLILHPMTIMECTLENPNYMNLDYEQAQDMCSKLLHTAFKYTGDVVLLWHNTQLSRLKEAQGSYQRKLYRFVLSELNFYLNKK